MTRKKQINSTTINKNCMKTRNYIHQIQNLFYQQIFISRPKNNWAFFFYIYLINTERLAREVTLQFSAFIERSFKQKD